ncbi:MAG TPA: TetR/AcrR family transcriptional regulator [Gemmatimonadales bacterium]|nr:TetR/AcrR family transcriptional regulator [Gemmatimonadales bacterium]
MTEVELSRRERKKEATKDRIFKAAFALFKRQGVEATTVDEICEKADIAKGTFFNYFPRKEAVFGYLAEDWFAQAEEESAAIVARPGRVGPQLITMFSELAAFYEEEPALAKYVLDEWMQRQHNEDDELCKQWDDLALRLIQKLQANGELRKDEAAERLAGVLHCVHQGTILEFVATPKPPFPLRTELRRRLMLAIEGLAPRGGK